jgi:hypothetical protein
MSRTTRAFGLRRLLAATLSLALVLASFLTVHSHAGHEPVHDRFQSLSADVEPGDHSDHGHSPLPEEADHSGCLDLICHGGFAFLSAEGDQVVARPLAVQAPTPAVESGGSRIIAPDRPPKPLVTG